MCTNANATNYSHTNQRWGNRSAEDIKIRGKGFDRLPDAEDYNPNYRSYDPEKLAKAPGLVRFISATHKAAARTTPSKMEKQANNYNG